jgi:hypothetical protein
MFSEFSSRDRQQRFSNASDLGIPHKQYHWADLKSHQTVGINHLLYHKDVKIVNKLNPQMSVTSKVNTLFEILIACYVLEYSKRLSPFLMTTDVCQLMRNWDISVAVYIKGSTASSAISNQGVSPDADLDTVIEFNRLPHDPRDFEANQEFYKTFTRNALKSVLKTYLAQQPGLIDPVSLAQVSCELDKKEFSGNDFLQNLILFRDNSLFLVSVGGVDFAFPVPRLPGVPQKCDNTFLHESLKIQIPCVGPRLNYRDTYRFGSEFNYDIEFIQRVFLEKIIVIPNPHGLQHNGFERLLYSVSKGWTTLEIFPVFVLIQEFFKRTLKIQTATSDDSPKCYFGEHPLDRLGKLLFKKVAQPEFALNIFLNGSRMLKLFEERGSHEAAHLFKIFQESFKDPRWQRLFPGYVKQFFSKSELLEELFIYRDLLAHIKIDGHRSVLRPHLEQWIRLNGKDGKEKGYFLSKSYRFEELYTLYLDFSQKFSQNVIDILFIDSLGLIRDLELSLKDELLILYFIKLIQQPDYAPIELEEIKKIFPSAIMIIGRKPELLRRFQLQQSFKYFFQKQIKILDLAPTEEEFIFETIEYPEQFPLISYFLPYFMNQKEVFASACSEFTKNVLWQDYHQISFDLLFRHFDRLKPHRFSYLLENLMTILPFSISNDHLLTQQKKLHIILHSPVELYQINLQVWIEYLERSVCEKRGEEWNSFVFNLFSLRPFYEYFFSSFLKKDLTPNVRKEFVLAILKNEYFADLEKAYHDHPALFDELNAKEQLPLILKFYEVKEYFKKIYQFSLELIQSDPKIFEREIFAKYFSKLKKKELAEFIFNIFKEKDGANLITELLKMPLFSEAIYAEKEGFFKVLHELKELKAFPNQFSNFILSIFLKNQTKASFPLSDFNLVYFTFKTLDLEDKKNIDFVKHFIGIAYAHLIEMHENKKVKDFENFKRWIHFTLVHKEDRFFHVDRQWLNFCLSIYADTESIKTLLEAKKLFSESMSYEEKVLKKIEQSDVKFSKEELKRFLQIFSEYPHFLSLLVLKLEQLRQLDLVSLVFQHRLDSATFSTQKEIIKEAISKNLDEKMIVSWIRDLNDPKKKGLIDIKAFLDLMDYFKESKNEIYRLEFFQLIKEKTELKQKFANDVFDYYLSIAPHQKLEVAGCIFSIFDKLDENYQNEFLFSPSVLNERKLVPIGDLAFVKEEIFEQFVNLIGQTRQKWFKVQLEPFLSCINSLANFAVQEKLSPKPLFKTDLFKRFLNGYFQLMKSHSDRIDPDLLVKMLPLDLKKELYEPLLDISVKHKEKLSKEYIVEFLMKIHAVAVKGKSGHERVLIETLIEELFEKGSFFECNKGIRLFLESKAFPEDQNNLFLFKLICLSIKEKNELKIEFFTQIKGFTNFSKIPEKNKKIFFGLFEHEIQNASNFKELKKTFNEVIKYAEYLSSSKRLDRLTIQALEKSILLLTSDYSGMNEFFEFLLAIFNIQNKVIPKSKLIQLDSQSLSKLGIDLAAKIELPLLKTVQKLEEDYGKVFPDLFKSYLMKTIDNFPQWIPSGIAQCSLEEIRTLLLFLETSGGLSFVKSEHHHLYGAHLLEKLDRVMSQEEPSESKSLALLMLNSILKNFCHGSFEQQYFKRFFAVFEYLLEPQNYFSLSDPTPFVFVHELSCHQLDKLNKLFNEENYPLLLKLFEKLTPFFFRSNEDWAEICIAQKGLLKKGSKKELTKKFGILKTKTINLIIDILNQQISHPRTEILYILFGCSIKMKILEFENIEARHKHASNFLYLSRSFLKTLPKGFEFQKDLIQEEKMLHLECFLRQDRPIQMNFILSSIQIFLTQYFHEDLVVDFSDRCSIAEVIEALHKSKMLITPQDFEWAVLFLFNATRNFYRFAEKDPQNYSLFFKTILNKMIIEVNKILESISLSPENCINIFKVQRQLYKRGVSFIYQQQNLLANDYKALFSDLTFDKVHHALYSIFSHKEYHTDPFEEKLLYFQIIYSGLTYLFNAKEADLDLIKAREILECATIFYQGLMNDFCRFPKLQSNRFLHLLLNIGVKFLEFMPTDLMLHLFPSIISLVKFELMKKAPDITIFKAFFAYLEKYGLIQAIESLVGAIKSHGKEAYFQENGISLHFECDRIEIETCILS